MADLLPKDGLTPAGASKTNERLAAVEASVTALETATTLASVLTLLGVTSYADLTAANAAEEAGVIFYNEALEMLDTTTA